MIDRCPNIWIAGNDVGAPCEDCGHAIIAHRLDSDHRGECTVCEVAAQTVELAERVRQLELAADALIDYEMEQRERNL